MENPALELIPARAVFILALLAQVLAGASAAAAITAFTADKVVLDDNGRVLQTEKITMAGEKIRAESATGDMVMIFRHDLGLLWALAPEKKIYVEIPLDQGTWDRMTRGAAGGDRVRVLGREAVQGFSCTRKEVTRTRSVMGRRTTTTRVIWHSGELPMVLRSRSDREITTELRDIRPAEPVKKLFELPDGLRKVGNNMGLFLMYMRGRDTGPPTRIH
ncbi:MAG TPA: DUF4412 domain-containing protein [Desulfobulbus sp.]|nr:DUF4412 domain-containing protein [Desulfobulbus sp.]